MSQFYENMFKYIYSRFLFTSMSIKHQKFVSNIHCIINKILNMLQSVGCCDKFWS